MLVEVAIPETLTGLLVTKLLFLAGRHVTHLRSVIQALQIEVILII